MRYNSSTRQIEAGREAVAAPHAPMQEMALLHNSLCYASPHYNGNTAVLQEAVLQGLCRVFAVWGFKSCTAFVCLGGSAQWGPDGTVSRVWFSRGHVVYLSLYFVRYKAVTFVLTQSEEVPPPEDVPPGIPPCEYQNLKKRGAGKMIGLKKALSLTLALALSLALALPAASAAAGSRRPIPSTRVR